MYKLINAIEKAKENKFANKIGVFTVYRFKDQKQYRLDTMDLMDKKNSAIVPLVCMEKQGDRWILKEISKEAREKLINEALDDAYKLKNNYFAPELDNMPEKTIGNILFPVLNEWDLLDDGLIEAPDRIAESWRKRAEAFFRKYRDFLEEEYKSESRLYKDF